MSGKLHCLSYRAKILVRLPGFEPGPLRWQRSVLGHAGRQTHLTLVRHAGIEPA